MGKTAVVLFNLGGPDSLGAVRPFLTNLFSDPAIIGVPQPLRWLLARLIAARRAPTARAIYAKIGGFSPLLAETQTQAAALEVAMGGAYKVFVAMRYWHPLTEETVAQVKAWDPERVVLLPLYPQYSRTTTGSALECWREAATRATMPLPTETVWCYPTNFGLVKAMAEKAAAGWHEAASFGRPRVLFSAHGLPQKIIDSGDPYQKQVEETSSAVVEAMGIEGLDWAICYQSRVGPMKWIGPSLDEELTRAAADKVPVVVVPVAFVSEHSETLVELDIEYRHRAQQLGVPGYVRVGTVGCHPAFISGLADLVWNPGQRHRWAEGF